MRQGPDEGSTWWDQYLIDYEIEGTRLKLEAQHSEPPREAGSMKTKDDKWVVEGAITGYTQGGLHDRAYNYNRLLCPGHSKMNVKFVKPEITGSYYSFKVIAFGPANISTPCVLSMKLNGSDKVIDVQIKSESLGRTTVEFTFTAEEVLDENTVELTFHKGAGVLYLSQFTLEACTQSPADSVEEDNLSVEDDYYSVHCES